MGCLDKRVAIITGAASGIGLSTARRFVEQGARVLLVDNGVDALGDNPNPGKIDEVAHALNSLRRHSAEALALDVAGPGSAEMIVKECVRLFGALDALVHCAGLGSESSLLRQDDAELDRILAIHVRASVALSRAAAKQMVDGGLGGSIVLLSGLAGHFAGQKQVAQAIASGAINGLVRSAASDLKRHRVRINAILPTARTRQTEHLPLFSSIREGSMSPDSAAVTASYLASYLSENLTGELLGSAGGRIYAIRARESTGVLFDEAGMNEAQIAESLDAILRG